MSKLIVIRPRARPEEVQRKIEAALVRSAETDAKRIRVQVQGDRAVLPGRVRSWAENREAERTAWAAPGVREVDNRITVAL